MKPIIKWQGGKTQLLAELNKLKPKSYINYHEPFVGGGSFWLDLSPTTAYINDWNSELINLYEVVGNAEKVIMLKSVLDGMQARLNKITSKAERWPYYSKIRDLDKKSTFSSIKDYNRAARFIFLNKLGFNGRYRLNNKGEFNIPLGNYKKVNLYDTAKVDALSTYLQTNTVHFSSGDFAIPLANVKANDFVYMDPPYDPIVESESRYTTSKDEFSSLDQARLAVEAHRLTKIGARVMISNHDTAFIRRLFQGYNITVVSARRSINSKGDKRGNVDEVIIRNYDDNDAIIDIQSYDTLELDVNGEPVWVQKTI
jgi:DNA adenine methylase